MKINEDYNITNLNTNLTISEIKKEIVNEFYKWNDKQPESLFQPEEIHIYFEDQLLNNDKLKLMEIDDKIITEDSILTFKILSYYLNEYPMDELMDNLITEEDIITNINFIKLLDLDELKDYKDIYINLDDDNYKKINLIELIARIKLDETKSSELYNKYLQRAIDYFEGKEKVEVDELLEDINLIEIEDDLNESYNVKECIKGDKELDFETSKIFFKKIRLIFTPHNVFNLDLINIKILFNYLELDDNTPFISYVDNNTSIPYFKIYVPFKENQENNSLLKEWVDIKKIGSLKIKIKQKNRFSTGYIYPNGKIDFILFVDPTFENPITDGATAIENLITKINKYPRSFKESDGLEFHPETWVLSSIENEPSSSSELRVVQIDSNYKLTYFKSKSDDNNEQKIVDISQIDDIFILQRPLKTYKLHSSQVYGSFRNFLGLPIIELNVISSKKLYIIIPYLIKHKIQYRQNDIIQLEYNNYQPVNNIPLIIKSININKKLQQQELTVEIIEDKNKKNKNINNIKKDKKGYFGLVYPAGKKIDKIESDKNFNYLIVYYNISQLSISHFNVNEIVTLEGQLNEKIYSYTTKIIDILYENNIKLILSFKKDNDGTKLLLFMKQQNVDWYLFNELKDIRKCMVVEPYKLAEYIQYNNELITLENKLTDDKITINTIDINDNTNLNVKRYLSLKKKINDINFDIKLSYVNDISNYYNESIRDIDESLVALNEDPDKCIELLVKHNLSENIKSLCEKKMEILDKYKFLTNFKYIQKNATEKISNLILKPKGPMLTFYNKKKNKTFGIKISNAKSILQLEYIKKAFNRLIQLYINSIWYMISEGKEDILKMQKTVGIDPNQVLYNKVFPSFHTQIMTKYHIPTVLTSNEYNNLLKTYGNLDFIINATNPYFLDSNKSAEIRTGGKTIWPGEQRQNYNFPEETSFYLYCKPHLKILIYLMEMYLIKPNKKLYDNIINELENYGEILSKWNQDPFKGYRKNFITLLNIFFSEMKITGIVLSTDNFIKKYEKFIELIKANLLQNKKNVEKLVHLFIEIFAEPDIKNNLFNNININKKYTLNELINIANLYKIPQPNSYTYNKLKEKINEKNIRFEKKIYNRPRFLTWNLKGFAGCYIDKKKDTDRGYEKISEERTQYISINPQKIARPNKRVQLPIGDIFNSNPETIQSQYFIGYLFNNPEYLESNKIFLSFGVDNSYSLFHAFLASSYPDYLEEKVKSRSIIIRNFIDSIEHILDESMLRSLMNGELYLLLEKFKMEIKSEKEIKDIYMEQIRNETSYIKNYSYDDIVFDLITRLDFMDTKYNIIIFNFTNDNNLICSNINYNIDNPFIFLIKKNDGIQNRYEPIFKYTLKKNINQFEKNIITNDDIDKNIPPITLFKYSNKDSKNIIKTIWNLYNFSCPTNTNLNVNNPIDTIRIKYNYIKPLQLNDTVNHFKKIASPIYQIIDNFNNSIALILKFNENENEISFYYPIEISTPDQYLPIIKPYSEKLLKYIYPLDITLKIYNHIHVNPIKQFVNIHNETIGLLLNNALYVPTLKSKPVNNLEIITNNSDKITSGYFINLDEILYKKSFSDTSNTSSIIVQVDDKRVIYKDVQNFYDENYQRLRFELSEYLKGYTDKLNTDELKKFLNLDDSEIGKYQEIYNNNKKLSKSDNIIRKNLKLDLINIITNQKIDIFEKQNLLKNKLNDWIKSFTFNNNKFDIITKLISLRIPCHIFKKNKNECNNQQFCNWINNSCKLSLNSDKYDKYISLLILELINYNYDTELMIYLSNYLKKNIPDRDKIIQSLDSYLYKNINTEKDVLIDILYNIFNKIKQNKNTDIPINIHESYIYNILNDFLNIKKRKDNIILDNSLVLSHQVEPPINSILYGTVNQLIDVNISIKHINEKIIIGIPRVRKWIDNIPLLDCPYKIRKISENFFDIIRRESKNFKNSFRIGKYLIQPVKNDINILFRSIANTIHYDETNTNWGYINNEQSDEAFKLRQSITSWIQHNLSLLYQGMTIKDILITCNDIKETSQIYIKKMLNSTPINPILNTEGFITELIALTYLYPINIFIHTYNSVMENIDELFSFHSYLFLNKLTYNNQHNIHLLFIDRKNVLPFYISEIEEVIIKTKNIIPIERRDRLDLETNVNDFQNDFVKENEIELLSVPTIPTLNGFNSNSNNSCFINSLLYVLFANVNVYDNLLIKNKNVNVSVINYCSQTDNIKNFLIENIINPLRNPIKNNIDIRTVNEFINIYSDCMINDINPYDKMCKLISTTANEIIINLLNILDTYEHSNLKIGIKTNKDIYKIIDNKNKIHYLDVPISKTYWTHTITIKMSDFIIEGKYPVKPISLSLSSSSIIEKKRIKGKLQQKFKKIYNFEKEWSDNQILLYNNNSIDTLDLFQYKPPNIDINQIVSKTSIQEMVNYPNSLIFLIDRYVNVEENLWNPLNIDFTLNLDNFKYQLIGLIIYNEKEHITCFSYHIESKNWLYADDIANDKVTIVKSDKINDIFIQSHVIALFYKKII
jgi:hypothetical protein